MRATERHHLKQDRFAETAGETLHWAVEHRNRLIYGAIAAIVVLALILGSLLYMRQREQAAAAALSKALQVYQSPLGPPSPDQPAAGPTFNSFADRARAAQAEFQKVASSYGRTPSGKMARYLLGITEMELGDTPGAERDLKASMDTGGEDIASLAKFALASLYRQAGRHPDAVKLYRELADKPTNTVAKSAAQLELADTYAAMNQKDEARKLYEQIRKDQPTSAAAELAAARQGTLK